MLSLNLSTSTQPVELFISFIIVPSTCCTSIIVEMYFNFLNKLKIIQNKRNQQMYINKHSQDKNSFYTQHIVIYNRQKDKSTWKSTLFEIFFKNLNLIPVEYRNKAMVHKSLFAESGWFCIDLLMVKILNTTSKFSSKVYFYIHRFSLAHSFLNFIKQKNVQWLSYCI